MYLFKIVCVGMSGTVRIFCSLCRESPVWTFCKTHRPHRRISTERKGYFPGCKPPPCLGRSRLAMRFEDADGWKGIKFKDYT